MKCDHLIFHRRKAQILWNLLFYLFGVSWVLSCSLKETFLGWHRSFMGKACKKVWQAGPLCIFWTVWKERNLLSFDNEELSIQRLKNSFVCNLWSWFRVSVDMNHFSLVSFMVRLIVRAGDVFCFFPSSSGLSL